MAQEVIWQDGHHKCQGSGCGHLVYTSHERWPDLCWDCVRPKIEQMRAAGDKLRAGEITEEEHNKELAAIG